MRRALVPSPELGGVRELPAAPVPTARQILCAVQELSSRLDRIEQLLVARGPVGDERHAGLLAALAESMADLDLPFTASEVLRHAAVDHPLGEALRAACEETTTALGTLFREIRGRDVGGLRLVRDGRLWRLERTSCTSHADVRRMRLWHTRR